MALVLNLSLRCVGNAWPTVVFSCVSDWWSAAPDLNAGLITGFSEAWGSTLDCDRCRDAVTTVLLCAVPLLFAIGLNVSAGLHPEVISAQIGNITNETVY